MKSIRFLTINSQINFESEEKSFSFPLGVSCTFDHLDKNKLTDLVNQMCTALNHKLINCLYEQFKLDKQLLQGPLQEPFKTEYEESLNENN